MSPAGLLATLTVEGSTKPDVLPTCLDAVLRPALRPGQSVVLGTTPSVHQKRGRALEDRSGGLAAGGFCLPCSPDFQPIEHAFAGPGRLLRKAKARTPREALESAVAAALATLTAPTGPSGWFTHCGFPLAVQSF